MASEIIVNTIKAPTTGANANTIIIGSGQSLQGTVDASAGLTTPAGMIIQTVTHSWDTNNQLSMNSFSWARYGASQIQITAKKANSLYVVHYQFPIASRATSACSTDIHRKVGSGGAWAALRVAATSGSNGYYGLGTLWGTNSTDDWSTPSLHSCNVVTSNAGDTIYFQAAIRSGGPGSDNTNGTQQAGHPYFTGVATVMEIAQ